MKEGLSYVNVIKFKYCRESDRGFLISLKDNSINSDEFTFVTKLKNCVEI